MNKHFTFADRVKLQYLIDTNPKSSAQRLAQYLGKSRGAIYYELKHNTTIHKTKLELFTKSIDIFSCELLSHFPFCCNPCNNTRCSHKSRLYDAYDANRKSHANLVNSRVDTAHRRHMIATLNKQLSQLIKDGQSIQVAMMSCSGVDVSESTIRRYINKGLLNAKRIDLPTAVRFKVKDQYNYGSRKKINARLLFNRTYDDYLTYIKSNPAARIVQLDSVIGKANDKTALLTIYFVNSKFQFAFKYGRKHSAINDLVLNLYHSSIDAGYKPFDIILTDNGSEFQKLVDIENDENGICQFKVFYCDPYCSSQKAECERNHGLIRRIIKKGKSLDLISQEDIDLAMSHINSYPRGSLQNLTPYDVFAKEYTSIILANFNISKISLKDIKLK